MKTHFILTIDSVGKDGDTVMRLVAAVQGFAHSMGLPLTMRPEDDPRRGHVEWVADAEHAVEDDDRRAFDQGRTILAEHDSMPKREFVRTLAKRTKKPTKTIGFLVRRWLDTKVMAEL